MYNVNTAIAESKSKVFSGESLLPFLTLCILFFPVSWGGFFSVYIGGYLLFLFLLIRSTRKSRKVFLLFLFLLVCAAVIGGCVSSFSTGGVWSAREYVRLPLAAIPLLSVDVNPRVFFKRFLLLLGGAVVLDFLLLYCWPDSEVSRKAIQLIAMEGMQDFLGDYWRHIGFGGNPNASAVMYSIFIIMSLFFFQDKARKSFLSMLWVGFTASLAFFLLIVTYSRTSLLALAASIFFMLLFSERRVYLVPVVVVVVVSIVINDDLVASLVHRFSSFTSLDARLMLWGEIVSTVTPATVLIGSPFPFPVVDNDYLYFIYRFGFVFGGILLAMPWIVMFLARKSEMALLLFGLLVFYYIAALPGGAMANPKTYILLMVICSVIYSSSVRNSRKSHEKTNYSRASS